MNINIDPISYEVIKHKIWQVLWEGRATMELVSGSVVVTEAKEVLYGLYDRDGNMVSSSAGLLLHMVGGERMIKNIIEWYSDEPGIYDGDIFFFNDAFIGGLHNPDQACIAPVFYEEKRVAWLLALFHTPETGAIEPAGMSPSATTIFHEGIRCPGVKLMEKGIERKEIFNMIQRMVRDPGGITLDARARIAALNIGRERVKELIDRYGLDTLYDVFKQMNIDAERVARAKLKELPDGVWRDVVYLDNDGKGYKRSKIMLTMTKEGDRLIFDFTGTDPQVPAFINLVYWGTVGCVFTVVGTRLFYEEYWNRGMMNTVKVIAPEGSLVNARWPAAVGGSALTGMPVMNLCHVTISKMLATSEKYFYDQSASWECNYTALMWGGPNQHGITMATVLFDCLAAGQGAGAKMDGVDTGIFPYTPEVIAGDIETYESVMPFLYLLRRQAPDSGGPGKYRGGAGLEIIYKVHNTPQLELLVIGYGKKSSCGNGLYGGHSGGTARAIFCQNNEVENWLKNGKAPYSLEDIYNLNGEIKDLPTMVSATPAKEDDIIYLFGDGGAGYGDPIDRDPELVLKDVINELTSIEYARDIYGVIIEPETSGVVTDPKLKKILRVNKIATDIQKEKIRNSRREKAK
jgi:N-methylhydantoinase B